MKQVKWLLGVLLGAALASSWWAAAVFGKAADPEGPPLSGMRILWLLPVLLTIACAVGAAGYLIGNWHED